MYDKYKKQSIRDRVRGEGKENKSTSRRSGTQTGAAANNIWRIFEWVACCMSMEEHRVSRIAVIGSKPRRQRLLAWVMAVDSLMMRRRLRRAASSWPDVWRCWKGGAGNDGVGDLIDRGDLVWDQTMHTR